MKQPEVYKDLFIRRYNDIKILMNKAFLLNGLANYSNEVNNGQKL